MTTSQIHLCCFLFLLTGEPFSRVSGGFLNKLYYGYGVHANAWPLRIISDGLQGITALQSCQTCRRRKKYTLKPVGTFSVKQLIQYQQLWTCSRSPYLVWTVPLRCTIHLFSLQLTRWIILRSDKSFCSKRCLWNRGNVEAFFIVRLFGHNTGNLMTTLADGAPQEAGVSEQRHRGREEQGWWGGNGHLRP